MAYQYSSIDKNNLNWFPKDNSRATLLTIKVTKGKMRGLENITINFSYPLTAIAGRNGSGKTTAIALAACAYHNIPSAFRLQGRKNSYYTFSDFFIQTKEETSDEGVSIRYKFLHNHWYTPKDPSKAIGEGWQTRSKRKGGRWNNYDRRIRRTVVYLGIDRIVPHSERSVAKTYKKLFVPVKGKGWEKNVKETVGKILGKDYANFYYDQHTIYRIPVVSSCNTTYSGFNMGAGEESLFELFSTINECPDGSLILIDEIELGLHEEAQAKLINLLKKICEERKFQIICTTHSSRILECIPPEGRVFLERTGTKTEVIPEISAPYASGKLSGRLHAELDIFVEDEIAKVFIENSIAPEIRTRVKITPIGSSTAVVHQIASKFREGNSKVCAILDGDKAKTHDNQIKLFTKELEKDTKSEPEITWLNKRTCYLPGETWPENWVVSQNDDSAINSLSEILGVSKDKVSEFLQAAIRAGKHKEFYEISQLLNLSEEVVTFAIIKAVLGSKSKETNKIEKFITDLL